MSELKYLYLLCKDNANERQVSLLTVARVQLILCKDNNYYLKNQLFLFISVDLTAAKRPMKCRKLQIQLHNTLYLKQPTLRFNPAGIARHLTARTVYSMAGHEY